MAGATSTEREAEVVLQVWEWWFLKFDLPLRHHGTPHTAPCTMATLTATAGLLRARAVIQRGGGGRRLSWMGGTWWWLRGSK